MISPVPRATLAVLLVLSTLLAFGGAGRALHGWAAHGDPGAIHAHRCDEPTPAPERNTPAEPEDCGQCFVLAHATGTPPGGAEGPQIVRASGPVVTPPVSRVSGCDELAPGPGRGPPKTA